MKPNNVTPSIRFAGFTDTWEQRKAKDLCFISTGKSNTQDSIEDGTYPFYVRSPIVEKSNRYLFDEEAVLTVGDGVGTGKVFHYVNGKYDLHQRVYRMFGFTDDISAKFFYYFFSTHFYDRVMSMTAKTSVDSVRLEMIADMDIQYPKVREQKAISDFFDGLNNLITLHQRKYDQLVNIKKSMLEKMFPKNGETVPEVRFAGFTDAWEQRKVSEIGSFSKGTGYSKSDIRDKGTPLILYGRLYTKYETVIRDVDTFTTPKDGSVYSRGGEVIIPASGETAEDISIASVVEKSGVILGGDLNIVTPQSGIDSAFLALSISHGEAHRSLSKLAQGKSVVHIHNSDIQTVEVGIPVQAEQESISQFFEGVDRLITLHQRKLERLQNIKKACLEKMFV